MPALLFAENIYPHFTTNEIHEIKILYGQSVKKRILDYHKHLQLFKGIDQEHLVAHINCYCNHFLPQYDSITYGTEEYWATPKEFLIHGYGDCEDYAIIKYYTLIALGYDKENLFLTRVKEISSNSEHMVLSYFHDLMQAPLILDNLSFRVLPLTQRTDLQALVFINENGVFYLDENHTFVKIAPHHPLFKNLLEKVDEEIKVSQ